MARLDHASHSDIDRHHHRETDSERAQRGRAARMNLQEIAPMTKPTRTPRELSIATHDGVALFYRHWPAASARRRGGIVLFHRGHEHSGRMAHLVDELDLPDFDFYAWDSRGHGRSPGERGFSPSFATSVRDADTFVRHITREHGVGVED